MANSESRRKVIKNKIQTRPLTKNDVIRTARMQYHINQLHTDYDQVVLRVSHNIDNGLKNGAPPPTVGF